MRTKNVNAIKKVFAVAAVAFLLILGFVITFDALNLQDSGCDSEAIWGKGVALCSSRAKWRTHVYWESESNFGEPEEFRGIPVFQKQVDGIIFFSFNLCSGVMAGEKGQLRYTPFPAKNVRYTALGWVYATYVEFEYENMVMLNYTSGELRTIWRSQLKSRWDLPCPR